MMDEAKAARVGARVRDLRVQRRGLTQRQLADEIEVDSVYLSRIERGVVEPSERLKVRLAAALGCTVGWLEREDEDAGADAAGGDDYPNKRAVMASPDYARCPDAVKEWFASLRRGGGDLSIVGWSSALAKGMELFELGLLATRGGRRVTTPHK